MEAATERSSARELRGDKAARIVEAMRASVADRGIAGSTFDHVAREAGVSRGLLHYYFGTKERLLVEVVRRECEVRGELLEAAVAGATSAADVLDALVRSFEDFLGEGPSGFVMFYELLLLGQRNEDIGVALAELGRRLRLQLAGALQAKCDAGALELRADPADVAGFLFMLADGVAIRRLSEPELDIAALIDHAVLAARPLLG
jgi:AcrR family transcriptional regulator